MRQGRWAGERATPRRLVVARCTSRAARSACLPELPQLLAQLLAGSRPVSADRISNFRNMTLQIQLVLLEPRDVELLSRSTALKLTGNVLLVITDNPARDVRDDEYSLGLPSLTW